MLPQSTMRRIILTLDLDPAAKPDYVALDAVMREMAFKPVAPRLVHDSLRVTYFGTVDDPILPGKVREYVWQVLKKKQMPVTVLHGGEYSEWGAIQHQTIEPRKP